MYGGVFSFRPSVVFKVLNLKKFLNNANRGNANMANNVKTIINDLVKNVRTWPEKLNLEKKRGIKIVGYTGRFIPEELIYAAGAKPFLICRGGEPEPTEATLPYMLRVINPFARAQLGYYILGVDPVIPMLDLIVAQCDDCHMARMADLMEYFKFPTIRIGVPNDWKKEISSQYYYKGLVKLKVKLEELTGILISDRNLKVAIDSINTIRSALRNINQLRKIHPPPIGGYDFLRLNHASFYCDLYEFTSKLSDLCSKLKKKESSFSETAPRILLGGRVIAVGDYLVPKLIEDLGGVIVCEFLDEGVRHCQWNVRSEGNLMANLKETYFIKRIPPSIFQPAWRERVDHMKKIIIEFKVEGVIWYQLSFDEIYDIEYPIIAKSMEEINIPILRIESSYEYAREATESLKTKVESFIGQLKKKRR